MRDREPDLVEQAYLYAYPNEDRVGCPPESQRSATLEALARKQLPIDHPLREHLGQCSPCFREFVVFRNVLRAERARARSLRFAAAAALLLIGGSLATYMFVRKPAPPVASHNHVSIPPTEVALNYEDISPIRGEAPQRTTAEQRAPRKLDALEIRLPFGSDDGMYQVQIRNGGADGAVLQTYTGSATIRDGHTTLDINADFSTLPPGPYVLAFRHADASWRFAPLTLE
jgi:hypothetical protein